MARDREGEGRGRGERMGVENGCWSRCEGREVRVANC